MKHYSLLILVSFLLLACSKYKSKPALNSGGDMPSSVNGNSITSLNFRINQDAIDEHSSLYFLGQLRSWVEKKIPLSWPEAEMTRVLELFMYLHKQEEFSDIAQVLQSTNSNHTVLVLKYLSQEDFSLSVKKDVSWLRWENHLKQDVVLNRIDKNTWFIKIDDETLWWRPLKNKLCYIDQCIDFSSHDNH